MGTCDESRTLLRSVASCELSAVSGSYAASADVAVRSTSIGCADWTERMISSTGAGSLRAANFIGNAAAKDGTFLGVFGAPAALEPLFEYSWEKNPFVGGNKHCFAAGQVKMFAKEMALPYGRVHLAGECLRRMEPGMESAMETAEIAALEILERA